MNPSDLEIAALAATHTAPLGADKVPDKNQAHHCFSCGAPIRGLFCDACGQKNDNLRRSIFSLAAEFFGSITGIESRIWRTWGALLFKPGKVAREFSDGKRTKWTSPVRAFLAMSIILFGYMGFTGTQLISVDLHPVLRDGVDKPAAGLTDDDYVLDGGIYFFESKKATKARNAAYDYALLERMLMRNENSGFNLDIGTDGTGFGWKTEKDVAEDSSDEDGSANTHADTESTEAQKSSVTVGGKEVDFNSGIQKLVELVRDPREINGVFYTWLPRIMFLMMPFSMFIGIIFIRGRGNALMYDHLVHAAYIHAVLYFLIFAGIIFSRITHGGNIAIAIAIGMLLYLPMSLKRMFGRSWFKSVWTAYGVGFIYLLTIVLILLGLLIFGVVQSVGPLP